MISPLPPISQVRWLSCLNTGVAPLPAFTLVSITGVDSAGVLQVAALPGLGMAAEGVGEVAVCGPVDLPANGNGVCTIDFPATVLYEPADGIPNAGEMWGVAAGSSKVRKNCPGFICLSNGDPGTGRVWIKPNPSMPFAVFNCSSPTLAISNYPTTTPIPWNGAWEWGLPNSSTTVRNSVNAYTPRTDLILPWAGDYLMSLTVNFSNLTGSSKGYAVITTGGFTPNLYAPFGDETFGGNHYSPPISVSWTGIITALVPDPQRLIVNVTVQEGSGGTVVGYGGFGAWTASYNTLLTLRLLPW